MKQIISLKDLPIEKNGKKLILEHNRVRLEDNGIVIKDLACRAGDKIEYTGGDFYILRGPKEKWRKILWDAGLTKGNWRHPNMINTHEVTRSFTVNHGDEKEYSITLWITNTGFMFWYMDYRYPPEVLLYLAQDMVKNMKAQRLKER